MKRYKLKTLILCLLLSLSSLAIGQDREQEKDDVLGGDFTIDVSGEINGSSNVSTQDENTSPIRLEESFISLSAAWKHKIRAVITAKLEHLFEQNGLSGNQNFSLQEFIREAYIEIREIGGTPVAVVVGKQPMAFGQNVQTMPIFNNNPLSNTQEIDEVYGVTVELTEGLFGLFDQVELSAFETQGGDLELGKIDGLSVRLSKFLTEQWLLTLSHAELGNSHLNSGHERRTSIGLIGETLSGDLVGWFEGVIFSNNPEYPNAKFALTGGASYRIHSSTDVVLEYTYVHRSIHDLGLAIKTKLTQRLSVGAEFRYRNYVERNQHEVILGLSMTYRFGTTGDNYNQEYLFGDKDEEDDEYWN